MVALRLGVVIVVPGPSEVPPVEAAYQLIVPALAVAARVTVPGPQLDPGVVPVIEGTELNISVAVPDVALLKLPQFVT